MAGRLAEDARTMLDGTHLFVFRGKVEPAKTRQRYGSRTHGTRLQCDVEIATDKPLAAEDPCRGTDDKHFRVRGRILQLERAIAGAGENGTAAIDDCRTDRHLAARGGSLRLVEGKQHWLWQFQSHRAR